ncbi:MAG: hypothetical protein VX938_10815, partial [Myxococcota bacterium]|nr:hypothetical protein [Myxococcota bacterium]
CQSTESCLSCPFDCGDCGGGGGGTCCAESTGPGCDNANCSAAVCALDPYCCTTAWDTYCVQCAQGGIGISSINCAGLGAVCGCSGGGGGGGNDSCVWSNDGICDEGTIWCDPGTDCTDCGTCF